MSKILTFGALLKSIREAKGFTQVHLAELTGLTQTEIARFEKDHRKPSWVAVHKLSKGLGITCDAFADAAETEAEKPRRTARPKPPAKKPRKPKK